MDVFWPDGKPASYVPPKPGKATSGLRSSSEYGMRLNPADGEYKKHWGIDLIGVKDGIVRAPFNGTVTIAAFTGGYGNLVEITASNGDRVRLGHNKSFFVKKGQKVKAGDQVAIWNNTGNSAGTHCHYETIPKGKQAVNPRDYMTAHAPTPGGTGDMSTLTTLNTLFDSGQEIGTTDTYLYINAKRDVSVTKGPLAAVWGALHFNFEVLTKPSRPDSTIQLRPVIATYIDGKVTDEFSIGTQEFLFTSGKQIGFLTVPPYPLATNRRLRFRAMTYDGAKIKVYSMRFLGAQVK